MPGDDEEHDHAVELVLGQVVACVLRLHERADEVVRRLCAPLREEVVEVGDELVRAAGGELLELRRQGRRDDVGRAERGNDMAAASLSLLVVLATR